MASVAAPLLGPSVSRAGSGGALEPALGVPGHGAAGAERAGEEAEAAEQELDSHGVRLHSPAACESFPVDFAALAPQARVVLTDSGGVQKEACWHGVSCVTLRTTTEWVETVTSGWNRRAGSDPEGIVAAVREAAPGGDRPPLDGDGDASAKIADLLCTMSLDE